MWLVEQPTLVFLFGNLLLFNLTAKLQLKAVSTEIIDIICGFGIMINNSYTVNPPQRKLQCVDNFTCRLPM